jgi:hypothetical protein
MGFVLDLHLIRLFNFYLAFFFLLGTYIRWRQYHTFWVMLRSLPGRWPRLFSLVKQHKHIFVTWGTLMPLALMLGLLLANGVASRVLWPHADLTLRQLLDLWPVLPVILLSGAGMVAFDVYGAVQVGTVDRAELEKYFDQAEYWLKSWVAPVVHLFTLGYVNPRQMVAVEVRAALVSASALLNSTVWWVITQTGLRIAFALSLWLTYAFEPWLRRLTHG